MKERLLIIDRDGTLIKEPPEDCQVDSLEKLEFMPGVFHYLSKIYRKTDYRLVMVSNQDGLGTDSFPEETFWPAHNKMLKAFENEDIRFADIRIDRSLPEENAPTRKPRTGLMTAYFNEKFDLENSVVIGDRETDAEFARNLGAKSILLEKTNSKSADFSAENWEAIYQRICQINRQVSLCRKTTETNIHINLNLYGTGQYDIRTGNGFFDHMLEQFSRHGQFDLQIEAAGDTHTGPHHLTEDTGLLLGRAFKQALADKSGIERYGFFILPMDDALAQAVIDFSGRPAFSFKAKFLREKIGDLPTEMIEHFFKSFSDTAACNLHLKVKGRNDHHKAEALFKAFAKATKAALTKTNFDEPLSTKGIL